MKKYGKILFFTLAVLFCGLNCGSIAASVQQADDTVKSLNLIQPQSENQTTWEITGENSNALLINAFVRVNPCSNTPGFRKFTSKDGVAYCKAENLNTAFGNSTLPGHFIQISQNFDKAKEYFVYFLRRLII